LSPAPGSRIGGYEITAPLGAGGMGEVYRATDTVLKRQVALKVLPPDVASDPERVARFQREAEVLASLNHPNIAHLYGLERSAGTLALVMELVEGPTLADQIAKGPIPLEEALPIARQIAEALEAAHEHGIIHRDLKPANIKVREDGTVKVLDFGLAKAMEPVTSGGNSPAAVTNSPTITSPALMTGVGVLLGTAAYMSPEQARGRPADKRSDIWAFGCVLYELLTGKRAFDGDDVADTLAVVLRGDPDWRAVPPDVPGSLSVLLHRCLEKDRRQRIADISIARFLLTETIAPTVPPTAPHVSRRRDVLIAGGATVLTAALAWVLLRSVPPAAPEPIRFLITPPAAAPLSVPAGDLDFAISPDGTRVVYRSQTPRDTRLMVRALRDIDAVPLITSGADSVFRDLFVSPDGHWVGFFTADTLMKVAVSGGSPLPICRCAGTSRGATWGPDGTVIFATSDLTTGLMSVPANGGDPKVLTKPDRSQAELDHLYPSFLPDGHGVLFTVVKDGAPSNANEIAVLDLKSGEQKTVIRGGTQGVYVDPGYVVYATGGTLRAVRFDAVRRAVVSDPVLMVDQVLPLADGAAAFATSRAGSLVFISSTVAVVQPSRSLTWVNRDGREVSIAAALHAYEVARLSPDGTKAVVQILDRSNDIWIWDFARETLTPLSTMPNQNLSPMWTPDSRRVIWGNAAERGVPNLYWQAADGTGRPDRLTNTANAQNPTTITKDGAQLLLSERNDGGIENVRSQIRTLDLPPSPRSAGTPLTTQPLLGRPGANFQNAEISPDGRWVAYQSDDSKQFEVYVSPYPKIDNGRWTISTAGGSRPVWSRNGRELFYLNANNMLTVVPVQADADGFLPGSPKQLLNAAYYPGSGFRGLNLRSYDVGRDGRFLMIKENAASGPDRPTTNPSSASLVVVVNWGEELRARMPTK
jgi:serine/threonine-protein kinase